MREECTGTRTASPGLPVSAGVEALATPLWAPTVDELFGDRPASTVWPSSARALLHTAIERLKTTTDLLELAHLEQLALAIVDLLEQLDALRNALSASLHWSYSQHSEIVRLRKRLANLANERRVGRRAA